MPPSSKTNLFAILASLFLLTLTVISHNQTPSSIVSTIVSTIPERSQLASLEGADSGLVGWWKFDEGSGTTAGDSSGSNSGTLTDGPIWSSGKIGGALSFDGVNDYIQTNLSILSPNENVEITVAGWLRTATSSNSYTIASRDQDSSNKSWQLISNVLGAISWQQYSGTVGAAITSDNNLVPLNTWVHIVATRTTSTIRLYLNGVEVKNGASTIGGFGTLSGVRIGLARTSYNTGSLDDVRIYNRALSASEITELYNYTGGNVTTPPPDTTPPSIPTNLSASAISSSNITISWNTSTDNVAVTGYKVFRNGTQITTVTSPSFNDTGLSPNTTYSYTVSAYDAAGNNTSQSTALSANTLAVTPPPPVSGIENIYISQNGSGDGSSCANSKSVVWFNGSANWGAGSGKISPGDTAHLCGTIANSITVQRSGASGQPITILFEYGAKISAPYFDLIIWNTTRPAIFVSGLSYIIIDGGQNGIIESTAVGTVLANKYNQRGVWFNGCNNCEVKNLTIRDMYVRTPLSSDRNGGGMGIHASGNNNLIHDNVVSEGNTGIGYNYPGNNLTENVKIYNNKVTRVSNGITFGSGNTGALANNVEIYNNDISDLYVWDGVFEGCTGDCWFHNDGIQLWAVHSGSKLTNLKIYNNYVHGDLGRHITGWIFVEGTVPNSLIYNNVLLSTGTSYPSNGMIMAAGRPGQIYNNTVYTNGICLNIVCDMVVKNNILRCGVGVGIHGLGTVTVIDNNIYQFTKTSNLMATVDPVGGAFRFSSSFQAWQTKTGFDAHSRVIDPGLVDPANGDFHLKPGSPAIDTGADLSSVGIIKDISGTPRPQGNAWDIGAYEYYSGQVITPPIISPLNGSCSTSLNICTTGTFSDITDTATNNLWSCLGSHGGTTASCSSSKTVVDITTPPVDTPTETPIANTITNPPITPPVTNPPTTNPPSNPPPPPTTPTVTVSTLSNINKLYVAPTIKQKTVTSKVKTAVNIPDNRLSTTESIIDITVPKIPSWREVIANLITDIFNRIRMGIQRTMEVIKFE